MTTTIQTKDAMVVQTYGNSDEVYSLAKRIKTMVPGGSKLHDSEAQALAQVALVTQCNPFIGEIWYIPGRGPMIGIKGARRHGNKTLKDAGGNHAYFTADLKPCAGEVAGYKGDIKDLAAAYECTVTDSVSTKTYQALFMETLKALRDSGSPDPVGEAREICGNRPQWKGYGYSTVSEKTVMGKQAVAMKRAEADGLKRRFDIPFGTEVADGDSFAEVDAAWTETPPTSMAQTVDEAFPIHEMTYEEARDTIIYTQNGNERLLGELPVEQLNKIYLSDKYGDKEKRAIEIILKNDFNMDAPKQTPDQAKKELGF